ncbi:hypothetical protein J3458_021352 [Metarhizium acridum]|uniref:uncharacterized protein n=1 Tax=Metarhizium acridum TaxID=92637 RepID=UPI001C6C1C5E|nr:hypothetical protein J3458_021352 [Metarhizium acridum]
MVSNVFAVAVAAWVVQMATALPADSSINVVGGTGSDGSKTPFIVALQNNRRFFCGGSLADDQTVITAAHCIQDPRDVQRLTIRAGSLSPSSGGTVVPVASAIVHPEWDPDRFNNDIAILKLAKSVGGNQSLGFAPLPKQDSDPTEGTNLVVAGWGATREGSKNLPGQLREVAVPVVRRDQCQRANEDRSGRSRVNKNMFCAGLPEGGKDACQGDSGGPIVDETGTLVGIVSFGEGCARANRFGIYTRLGKYVNFVQQNMGSSQSKDDDF